MQQSTQEPTGWVGWIAFAGFMMIMIGVFHAISGIAGIAKDSVFVAGSATATKYVFKFNAETWGWIHLIWGIIVLIAGFSLFSGAVWARTVGVIVAMVSAIANFAWIPYYPIWAIVVLTIDVLVIWALTAHGREIAQTS
jgi:hypothetical protein